jgi:hypothetical protein
MSDFTVFLPLTREWKGLLRGMGAPTWWLLQYAQGRIKEVSHWCPNRQIGKGTFGSLNVLSPEDKMMTNRKSQLAGWNVHELVVVWPVAKCIEIPLWKGLFCAIYKLSCYFASDHGTYHHIDLPIPNQVCWCLILIKWMYSFHVTFFFSAFSYFTEWQSSLWP